MNENGRPVRGSSPDAPVRVDGGAGVGSGAVDAGVLCAISTMARTTATSEVSVAARLAGGWGGLGAGGTVRGGAIGLALINTLLNDRTDLHLARLHESLSWGHTKAEETLANLTQAYATLGSDAELAALKRMALLARRESLVMALGDVFFVLTIAFFLLVPLVFIMRRPRPFGSNAGH